MSGNRAASPVDSRLARVMAEEVVRRDRSPNILLTTAKLLIDLMLGLRNRIVKEGIVPDLGPEQLEGQSYQ